MDCIEIKKLLDQYIGNDLSKDASGVVRKHLLLCRDCSAELALLKKYRKEMASLKDAKAPVDFLQQLNLRIDKQSNTKRIIRALFFPLKIKLPIEALGVIAASAFIVFLINPIDQMKDGITIEEFSFNGKTVEVSKAPKIADSDIFPKKTVKTPSMRLKPEDDRMLAKAERKAGGVRVESVRTREIVLALYQVKGAAAPGNLKNMDTPSRAIRTEEQAVVTTDINKDKAAGAAAERVKLPDSAKSEMVAEDEKETQIGKTDKSKKLNAVQAQSESIVQQVTILQPVQDIKRIVAGLNGKVIKEVFYTSDQLNYIIVEIPAESQQKLLDKLSKLGNMTYKEKKTVDDGKSGKVKFKINITQME